MALAHSPRAAPRQHPGSAKGTRSELHTSTHDRPAGVRPVDLESKTPQTYCLNSTVLDLHMANYDCAVSDIHQQGSVLRSRRCRIPSFIQHHNKSESIYCQWQYLCLKVINTLFPMPSVNLKMESDIYIIECHRVVAWKSRPTSRKL